MRIGAFEILFFFICLNLSFYVINETQAIPEHSIEGVETPASIEAMTIDRIVAGGVILVIGTLISIALKQYVLGGTITVILFALELVAPVVDWVLFGFPRFLTIIDVPPVISTALTTIFAVVWFWFLIGLISQRYMEQ